MCIHTRHASTQVCWCTHTPCSVFLVKRRNTPPEAVTVQTCHSKPSWCAYRRQTHRSENCGHLHTAAHLETPPQWSSALTASNCRLDAGHKRDYSHTATLLATPHQWSSALTTSNCRLDAGHKRDYSHTATLLATPHHGSSALTTSNCRLDAGHRDGIIPTLQHSLLHHTTGHLHLPQATAGWMQATEMWLFPQCNTPCYTTPQVICTDHKQLQAGCRPQNWLSPLPFRCSLVDQVPVQHLPQTHLQAGCKPLKCIHPCTAAFLGRPGRCAELNTDTSSGHRDGVIPTLQLPQVYCFAFTTDTSAGHRDAVIPIFFVWVSFGSFSLRELTCMHCAYLALWTCKVLCGSFLCAIYKFSFIHSFILPSSLVHQVTMQLLPQTYRQAGCRPQRCGHPHTAMLPGTPAHWTAALLYCNTHSYVLDECLEHCCSEKPAMMDKK